MTTVVQRSSKVVARNILMDMNIIPTGDLEVPSDQIIAEYLRQNLCALATPPGAGLASEPVYVTRLLNRVRAPLRSLWPQLGTTAPLSPSQRAREQEQEGDTQPDPIRRVLNALHDLRDVAELGDGYWLPAPTHLVELASGEVLVVSGCGSIALKETLHIPVKHTWIARTIDKATLSMKSLDGVVQWQPFRLWLGDWNNIDLKAWTLEYLADAKRHAMQAGSDITRFEVYAPDQYPKQPQYFRWTPVESLRAQPDGMILCRSAVGRFRPTTYWLGVITKMGDVFYLKNEYTLGHQDVRRLMYGLDLLAGAPTQTDLVQTGDHYLLTVRSWLPAEERRLLLALTREVSDQPGRLPLRYSFTVKYISDIRHALRALGIGVQTLS